MAQYVAITTSDIPPLGSTGTAGVWRGDFATEAEAADAAALALNVPNSGKLWVALASNLTRYIATVTHSADATVG